MGGGHSRLLGKMPRSKSAWAARRRAKMKVRREAVSDEQAAALLAQSAPVFEAVLRAAGAVRVGVSGGFPWPSGLSA